MKIKKEHEHCPPETGLHTLFTVNNINNLRHRLMSYFKKSITGPHLISKTEVFNCSCTVNRSIK